MANSVSDDERKEKFRADLAERRTRFRVAIGIIVTLAALVLIAAPVASLFGRTLSLPDYKLLALLFLGAAYVAFNLRGRDLAALGSMVTIRFPKEAAGDEETTV